MMPSYTVQLRKPHKKTVVTFQVELVAEQPDCRVVRAHWERPRLDLGYVVFEPDDCFYEYYYTNRWFAIFELRSASGALKGWYCNISYPAIFTDDTIISDDLDLDLFVAPDREQMLRLDIDEFEERGVDRSDPIAYAAAYAAFDELEQMVRQRQVPFQDG